MSKLYYNQCTHQFEVAQFNPSTKQVEVIDSDTDFDALGLRQGFLSEDENQNEEDESEES